MIDLISIMEKKAKKKKVNVLVNEGCDDRVLWATDQILKEKLCKITLIGDPKEIKAKVKKLGLDIKDTKIVDMSKEKKLKQELAKELFELRKHKGMTIKEAKKLMDDHNYFGCMYVLKGYADALAGSCICPTAALMKPALQILRKKDSLVSEVAVLNDVKKSRFLFGADFSLNIDPSAADLAQITLNTVEAVREFDIEPKVAMLSFSTKGSGGDSPAIQKIRDAIKIVKEKDPKLLIDGELQVDAAVNPTAAKKKCPDSPLKGDANILIFPNLTAANIFCHGLFQFSDMNFFFTMLKGMQKPVAILGRSLPKETHKNMIVSCAMEANSE